jgi:hypothetical protein
MTSAQGHPESETATFQMRSEQLQRCHVSWVVTILVQRLFALRQEGVNLGDVLY